MVLLLVYVFMMLTGPLTRICPHSWLPGAVFSWPEPGSAWPGSVSLLWAFLGSPLPSGLVLRMTDQDLAAAESCCDPGVQTPVLRVHPLGAGPCDPPSPRSGGATLWPWIRELDGDLEGLGCLSSVLLAPLPHVRFPPP